MSQISGSLTNLPPAVLKLLFNAPVLKAPDGVQSNFIDPETSPSIQIVTTSIILGFVLLFFINRVYAKVFLMKRFTWDDGTLFLGLIYHFILQIQSKAKLARFAISYISEGVQKGRIGRH
ncbi:hypothetical protein BJ875DRAFT_440805 [Amylocarpus encephaloides]|uniref:Uncharacterized protein n=1 Tax=Amylocarpus encephaloides TaxID=45428 RepID=A0A9P8C7D4_9HELO|nr:hypothetical protein BJ875DRAFT_440805 [Amylocarpus encephaloides]